METVRYRKEKCVAVLAMRVKNNRYVKSVSAEKISGRAAARTSG